MEKELIGLIFIIIILITILTLLIFYIRKKSNELNYDEFIIEMNKQTENNLELLSKYEKEKNNIEEQIRLKKKKLGFKLIRKGVK